MKEVFIIIEVKETYSIFDITTRIPNNYEKILVGGNILIQTQILNFGEKEELDIKVKHIIKDISRTIITSFEKTIKIQNKINFTNKIVLPKLKPGKYSVYTQVSYKNISVNSYDEFTVIQSIKK